MSYKRVAGRSPEQLMVSDMPLLIAVGLWVLTALGILYVGGGR